MSITKKRFLSAFLALVLLCSVFVFYPEPAYAATLSDVANHWAEKYIKQAVEAGIVNGYEDGTFLPDKGVTRAEFIHMLNAALKNEGTTSVSFSDVAKSEWYYADVQKAVASGMTSGYEDDTFRPQNTITRQEAAVFLANVVPTYGATGNLKDFPDYSSVGDWALNAMERINGKGYIGAYADDGKLHPTDQLTRAQATKIICDILSNESIITAKTEITSSGTSLSGKIYSNGITVTKGVGSGSASIANSVVLGPLTINGGGDAVTVQNSRVAQAVIDANTDVKVIAKGETNILGATVSDSATLETSGLSSNSFGPGFKSVSLGNSANVVFTGNFPDVKVSGSSSYATFTSGTVENMTVSGKNSAITVETSATLTNVIVDTAASFHGNGTIRNMNVNANGVTYAKEPLYLNIANKLKDDDGDSSSKDLDSDISITPKYKASDVRVSTTIKLTFPAAITLYNGKEITKSNIEDFVELRTGSSSGKTVSYSAKIDSASKVITITPDKDLAEDTRYYVIIKKNSVADADGTGNAAFSSYFDTEGDDSSSSSDGYATYSPKNKATGVSVSSTLTITMSETVETYDGNSITTKDLENFIIELRRGSSSGTKVPFTATISSNKTIKIYPDSDLDTGTTYYLAIIKNEMRTKSGKKAIPASSITFTTSGTGSNNSTSLSTPVLTYDNSNDSAIITAVTTPKTTGTIYAVAVLSSTKAPTAEQVKAGKDGNGNSSSVVAKTEKITSANVPVGIKFTGLKANTSYTVYMVIEDKNDKLSGVVSAKGTTNPTKFTDLALKDDLGATYNLEIDDEGNVKPVWIQSGASKVSVTVANNKTFAGTITPTTATNIKNGVTAITIKVTKQGESASTSYKVNVYKMADITKITVKDSIEKSTNTITDSLSGTTFSHELTNTDAEYLDITVTLNDSSAKYIVKQGNATPVSEKSGGTVRLYGDFSNINIQVDSYKGVDEDDYKASGSEKNYKLNITTK